MMIDRMTFEFVDGSSIATSDTATMSREFLQGRSGQFLDITLPSPCSHHTRIVDVASGQNTFIL